MLLLDSQLERRLHSEQVEVGELAGDKIARIRSSLLVEEPTEHDKAFFELMGRYPFLPGEREGDA